MNLEGFYKETENNKIFNEITKNSAYQKDINNYYEIGYANGLIACIKAMPKDDRKMYIESIKEIYDKNKDKGNECKTFEYILRLYNDEFKAIEI